MAKNKSNKAVKDTGEEIIETDENLAETEEKPPQKVDKVDEVQSFINRKLIAINMLNNPAKQKRLVERLFRNKRGI